MSHVVCPINTEGAMTTRGQAMVIVHPHFTVESREPEYLSNYGPGYVGFTYSDPNFISKGIAYFTRWSRLSEIKATHALIVSGEDECIEAHVQSGVQRAKLSDYFNDPQCQIFFRKPVDLDTATADAIVDSAAQEIGCKYDVSLILGHATANSHIGKLIREIFKGNSKSLACKIMNNDTRWICSELVAHCLDEQPKYKGKGILSIPSHTIDPQELFEDVALFEAWANIAI
jgi:hypothetical protein